MACDSPLIVVSGMAFEAELARGSGIVTVFGLDPQKLIQDMETAIRGGAAALVSFGTAAGLSPSLAAGAIVIARQVHHATQSFAADAAWSDRLARALPDATVADMAGVDEPLATTEAKARLYSQTDAAAADMESHHVAQMARRHNLPFAILRVVLDNARCALPPAALAATTREGRVNYAALIGSLFKQPAQLPALLHLGKAHAKAKKALRRCALQLPGSPPPVGED